MSTRKYGGVTSIGDFIRVESERMLSACTRCGHCYDVCPMISYGGLKQEPATRTKAVDGVLAILRREKGTDEALAWVSVCTGSGECVPACPEDVNPLLMLRVSRMIASGGTGGEVQLKMLDDQTHFPRMRAYAAMQLSQDEFDKWL